MENNGIMGSRMRERRIELGMTQDELAQKMGYTSRSTINKIEKGVIDLTQSALVKLADVLDVDALYLLGIENQPDYDIQLTKDEKALIEMCRSTK